MTERLTSGLHHPNHKGEMKLLVRRFCFVFFILVLLLVSWLIGWVGRDVVAKRDSSSFQLYVRGCVEQFTEVL